MRKKLKRNAGFTMVEMLCAVAVLLLLCLLMYTGINMAVTDYRAFTSEAETQLLLDSLTDALADKLRYAEVSIDASGKVSYSIGGGKVELKANPNDSNAKIVTVGGRDLLPDGVYGNDGAYGASVRYTVEAADIVPELDSVDSSKVIFKISVKVKETTGDIGAEAELTVRCLNRLK